eukprot:jgi/Astpho2/9685/e_gw1.00147.4.1_t
MPGTVYLQESLTQDIACTVPVTEPATLHGDGDGKAFSSSDKVSEKARVVFDTCWRRLEERHPVRPNFICPHEIVWLNGAPGAGKGANTQFILQSRGLSRAVPMSDMLERNAEIRALIEAGELVPDTLVGDALLDIILDPQESDGSGLLIDGFPRTALQVDFLKLLFDKLMALHGKHADGPDENRFPRPSFKVVVLYVEQEESVRRQMGRAQQALSHNRRAADAGSDDIWELRATDADAAKCRRRYAIFKAHYNTVLRLKQFFPFSLIDAMGSLEDTRAQIMRELRYQSSLDLQEATYAAIRHLPLAADLVKASRQQLVHRLDTYSKRHRKTFLEIVRLIDNEAVPLLRRCSLAGHAELKTRSKLFTQQPLAADMLIDILSDRGFSVAHVVDELVVPLRVRSDGEIDTRTDEVHHFRMTFEKEGVREAAMRAAQASSDLAATAQKIAIGQTYIPSHMDREHRRLGSRAVPAKVGSHTHGCSGAAVMFE